MKSRNHRVPFCVLIGFPGIFDQGGDDTDGPKKVGKGKGFGAKTIFSPHLSELHMIILPRQARDRHLGNASKGPFLQAT